MNYESFKEISNQAEALGKTASRMEECADAVRAFLNRPGEVVFVACGSSYWLSMSGSRALSLHCGRKACAVKAGDIVMNPDEFTSAYEKPILICPSRSGTSSEVIKAIRILREAYGDVPVLSIVEYEDSALEKLSGCCIRLPWANEVSVCQTRSFSCLYLAVSMMAAIAAGNGELLSGLKRFVETAPDLYKQNGQKVEEIVRAFPGFNYLVALGSGKQYGVAIEGAYIGIEMALLKASYYTVLELRHGPIVTVDENTLVAIVSNGSARALEEGMAADVRRQGGKVLAVVDHGGFANADWIFGMGGEYPAEAVALYYIYLMQAFAYHQAVRLGLNPDSPGSLVPYITI